MTTITLSHDEINKALNLVAFAISTEATRYYLNGVLFEIAEDNTLRLVATDGHRLALYKPQGHRIDPQASRLSAIVPRDTVLAWLKDKPARGEGTTPVALTFTETSVQRSTQSTQSTSSLVDGSFPDWRRVVPDHSKAQSHAAPQFNALYMADVAKALKAATGDRKPALRIVTGESERDPMLLHSEVEGWLSVLMPVSGKRVNFADVTL